MIRVALTISGVAHLWFGWAPTTVAGHVRPTTHRCDVAPLLPPGVSSTLSLVYRVHQTMTFDIAFGGGGAAGTCDADLVPVPPARPYAPEPSVTPPPPAFATPGAVPAQPCPSGRVSLAAVRYALVHPTTELDVADASGSPAVTVASSTVDPRHVGNPDELGLALDVARTLRLRYTLTFVRDVP